MKSAARICGVPIVTGDTKVVDNGKADGLYVNTAGIGRVRHSAVGPDCRPVMQSSSAEILARTESRFFHREAWNSRAPVASDTAPSMAAGRGAARCGDRYALPARPDSRRIHRALNEIAAVEKASHYRRGIRHSRDRDRAGSL